MLCLISYQDAERFKFPSGVEEGRDRCPYDPAKGFTGLLIGMSHKSLLSLHFIGRIKALHTEGMGVLKEKAIRTSLEHYTQKALSNKSTGRC